jgi:hypothetical protein
MLTSHFNAAGENVRQGPFDAEYLMVCTALEVLVGIDTDLLAILIANTREHGKVMMLHPGSSNSTEKVHDIPTIQAEIGEMKKVVLLLMQCLVVTKLLPYMEKERRKLTHFLKRTHFFGSKLLEPFPSHFRLLRMLALWETNSCTRCIQAGKPLTT